MEINFFQNGNYYVAEFEVKTDFNLHIERDSGRKLYIYQCTSGCGDYALVNDFCNNNNQNVIDIDFTALVYPKRIKIVSDAEPTYATVVTDGEVTEIKTQSKEIEITSNGTINITPDAGFAYLNSVSVKTNVPTSGVGGGSASAWRYFDISKLDTRVKPMLLPFIVKDPYYNRIVTVSDNVIWADITAVGVDDSPKLMQDGVIMSWSQMMALEGLTPEEMAQQGIVEITEEEFYNFDVPVTPV